MSVMEDHSRVKQECVGNDNDNITPKYTPFLRKPIATICPIKDMSVTFWETSV